MEVVNMRINVSVGKKINLGNYENYDINLGEEIPIPDGLSKEKIHQYEDELFRDLNKKIETWEKMVKGLDTHESKRLKTLRLTESHIEQLRKGEMLIFPDKGIKISLKV